MFYCDRGWKKPKSKLTNLSSQIAQQKLFESKYHNLVSWNKIRETLDLKRKIHTIFSLLIATWNNKLNKIFKVKKNSLQFLNTISFLQSTHVYKMCTCTIQIIGLTRRVNTNPRKNLTLLVVWKARFGLELRLRSNSKRVLICLGYLKEEKQNKIKVVKMSLSFLGWKRETFGQVHDRRDGHQLEVENL